MIVAIVVRGGGRLMTKRIEMKLNINGFTIKFYNYLYS